LACKLRAGIAERGVDRQRKQTRKKYSVLVFSDGPLLVGGFAARGAYAPAMPARTDLPQELRSHVCYV
jgi:hypothetical protein